MQADARHECKGDSSASVVNTCHQPLAELVPERSRLNWESLGSFLSSRCDEHGDRFYDLTLPSVNLTLPWKITTRRKTHCTWPFSIANCSSLPEGRTDKIRISDDETSSPRCFWSPGCRPSVQTHLGHLTDFTVISTYWTGKLTLLWKMEHV